jgi:hypothetical protein
MENKVLLSDSGVIDVADDFAVHCLTLAQVFFYAHGQESALQLGAQSVTGYCT